MSIDERPQPPNTVNMTGIKCPHCGEGRFKETTMWDEMEGVLHCDSCGKVTVKYLPKEKL